MTPEEFYQLVRTNNHTAQLAAIRTMSAAERLDLACGLCALDKPELAWIDSYTWWLQLWSTWDKPQHADATFDCYAAHAKHYGHTLRYRDGLYQLSRYETTSWEQMKQHIVAVCRPQPVPVLIELPARQLVQLELSL